MWRVSIISETTFSYSFRNQQSMWVATGTAFGAVEILTPPARGITAEHISRWICRFELIEALRVECPEESCTAGHLIRNREADKQADVSLKMLCVLLGRGRISCYPRYLSVRRGTSQSVATAEMFIFLGNLVPAIKSVAPDCRNLEKRLQVLSPQFVSIALKQFLFLHKHSDQSASR